MSKYLTLIGSYHDVPHRLVVRKKSRIVDRTALDNRLKIFIRLALRDCAYHFGAIIA